MGKHKKQGGRGAGSTAKFFLKLGATLVGGAILGEVIQPLAGPVSGPALGIAVVGLPVYGFKRSYLTHALLPAVGFQALRTAQATKPMIVAKASVAGATKALKRADAGGDDQLARARALAGK